MHFQIQWKVLNRHIIEAGINTVFAWILIALTFIGGSVFLFSNYEYARYVYLVFPVFFSTRLSEFKRREFLKICYGARECRSIRSLENIIISLPFMMVLLVYHHYFLALFLVLTAFVLAWFQFKTKSGFVFPTPFQKRPFEFLVGFRGTVLIVFLIFALSIIAAIVGNYYLGLFALVVGFMTSVSYYTRIEDSLWVWVHSAKPKGFLIKKLKIAIFFNSLLYLPSTLILLYFFDENVVDTLIVYIAGNAALVLIIFAKYAAFPRNIGVKEGIIISVGIYFPPLLIALIPFFYFQSLKSLRSILK